MVYITGYLFCRWLYVYKTPCHKWRAWYNNTAIRGKVTSVKKQEGHDEPASLTSSCFLVSDNRIFYFIMQTFYKAIDLATNQIWNEQKHSRLKPGPLCMYQWPSYMVDRVDYDIKGKNIQRLLCLDLFYMSDASFSPKSIQIYKAKVGNAVMSTEPQTFYNWTSP